MASRGRRKSVGVVEMARDLGISTATVSRALNGSSRRSVPRCSVRQAAGYHRPGPSA